MGCSLLVIYVGALAVGGNPQQRARRSRSAFTLIEILVVLVVLAILASLVGPDIFRNVDVAKDATARTQIEILGAALDAYRLDNGHYPTTDQGLAALQAAPTSEATPNNW